MSVTYSTRSNVAFGQGSLAIIDVTLDSSYPTGGEAYVESDFNFAPGAIVALLHQQAGGRMVEHDVDNKKWKVLRDSLLKKAVISGGSAGNLTVTGIATTDTLLAVLQVDLAASFGTLKKAIIAGGSAGNLTLTGIATTDTLIEVVRYDVELDTGTGASGNKVAGVTDITSEFTISATNTINNTGGTDTSGDRLEVLYMTPATAAQGFADLTSEFTISATNTINNTGGTATTGDKLLVLYESRDAVEVANASDQSACKFSIMVIGKSFGPFTAL